MQWEIIRGSFENRSKDLGIMMPQVNFGTNSSICITPDSEEQAKQLFDGLSAQGQVGMPLEKMF